MHIKPVPSSVNPYQHREPTRDDWLCGHRSWNEDTVVCRIKVMLSPRRIGLSYSLEEQAILRSCRRRTLSFVVTVR